MRVHPKNRICMQSYFLLSLFILEIKKIRKEKTELTWNCDFSLKLRSAVIYQNHKPEKQEGKKKKNINFEKLAKKKKNPLQTEWNQREFD